MTILPRKPFTSCAKPRNTRRVLERIQCYAGKLGAIKAWLGTDYVLHPEYKFQERHRLIVEAK